VVRSFALALTLCLGLTGCASGPSLDDVKVRTSSKSVALTVPKNYAVDQTIVKVLSKGHGELVRADDTVKVDYSAYNGRTGRRFDSSFESDQPMRVTLAKQQALPGFITALKGQRVGARILAAVPPINGFGADRPELGLRKSDSMVVYFHVLSKIPLKAHGKAKSLPGYVPAPRIKNGHPIGFTKTASTPATLGASSAHVVIQGTGRKVSPGGSVLAHYLGQGYPDGAVFDGSWERGAPAPFQLDGVIDCWKKLLPGVRVGSRVILLCTAADAYGDSPPQGSTTKPGDSLMFVVDVLDAG
jgi:peptidylprolyl isomerase